MADPEVKGPFSPEFELGTNLEYDRLLGQQPPQQPPVEGE